MTGQHMTQPMRYMMSVSEAPYVLASIVQADREASFELSLLLSFFKTISDSPLLCGPCKQGLYLRYLASTLYSDLRDLIENYIAKVSIETELRGLLGKMFFDFEKLAENDAQPKPRDEEQDRRDGWEQPADSVSDKSWDCADIGRTRELRAWLRRLACTEGLVADPVGSHLVRSSAWRSRVWIATAGVFTLDDLRRGRGIAEFLRGHEQHVLESCCWSEAAQVSKEKVDGCECFRVSKSVTMFPPRAMTVTSRGETIEMGKSVYSRRVEVISLLLERGLDTEIAAIINQDPPDWPVAREVGNCALRHKDMDPFAVFEAHWRSTDFKLKLDRLTEGAEGADLSETAGAMNSRVRGVA